MKADHQPETTLAAPAEELPEGWQPPTCAQHAGVKPVWRCRGCGELLCPACVKRRMLQTLEVHFCVRCGGDCEALHSTRKRSIKAASTRSFASQLGDSFAYPLRHHGWGVILGGALLLWLVDLLAALATGLVASVALGVLQLLLLVFGTGYLAAYMFSVIQTSARGDDRLPDWPDFGDIWNDMFLPLFRLFGTLFLCFGPAVLLHRWLGGAEYGWVFWGAFSVGLLYAPMALIGVAQFESLAAVNPLLVIPSILKTFGSYLVACLILAVAVVFGSIAPALSERFVPWVGGLVSWCLALYFLFVQMRVLGVLYHCRADRLNWFGSTRHTR